MIIKTLKTLLLLIYTLGKIDWIRFMKLYSSTADNVIFFSFLAGRFSNEIFLWDLSNINNMIENEFKFKVAIKLDSVVNKRIWWSPSVHLVPRTVKNYPAYLFNEAQQIESRDNELIPSAYETSLYENKSHMHKLFESNEIRTPKTSIFSKVEEFDGNNLSYPVLLKGEYSSGSRDIYKFSNVQELSDFLTDSDYLKRFDNLILQELLNIRRDLRVTVVGDEIVLFYWRINNDSNWKPTASSYGGTIVFSDFPMGWEKYIIDNFKKLNLKMGAFDVAWADDDLANEPYFLEVSPRFSPNPPLFSDVGMTYGKWKKKLFGKEVYYKKQADLIFNISRKHFNLTL